mgnify:CR=1 FL=1
MIREIAIAYMTPYIRDVHDTGFQTLSSWSGTWGVLDGEQYRSSGVVDVYQDNAQISFDLSVTRQSGSESISFRS